MMPVIFEREFSSLTRLGYERTEGRYSASVGREVTARPTSPGLVLFFHASVRFWEGSAPVKLHGDVDPDPADPVWRWSTHAAQLSGAVFVHIDGAVWYLDVGSQS